MVARSPALTWFQAMSSIVSGSGCSGYARGAATSAAFTTSPSSGALARSFLGATVVRASPSSQPRKVDFGIPNSVASCDRLAPAFQAATSCRFVSSS